MILNVGYKLFLMINGAEMKQTYSAAETRESTKTPCLKNKKKKYMKFRTLLRRLFCAINFFHGVPIWQNTAAHKATYSTTIECLLKSVLERALATTWNNGVTTTLIQFNRRKNKLR